MRRMDSLVRQMDTATFSRFTRMMNSGENLSKKEFYTSIDTSTKVYRIGEKFFGEKNYDTLIKGGKEQGGWFTRRVTEKFSEISEKYKDNEGGLLLAVITSLLHYIPQMLFISLPLFALFLKLIYIRRKSFYFVSHGIYSVHLYIFYFIVLLLIIGINKLTDYFHWSWFSVATTFIFLGLLFYEYKAMRNFYGQGRAKTMIKFLLAVFWRFFVIIFLLIVFSFLSVLKV